MKFRDCETCMVYGTDNKPLSRARVETDAKDKVTLYFNNYKLRSVRFKTFVDFYDMQQGLMRARCELVIRKNVNKDMAEPWMADVKVLEVADVFQRQKDLRVRVNISTSFTTDDGRFFSGTIKNISAGGIFLVTSQALQPETRFSFSYRFDGNRARPLPGFSGPGGLLPAGSAMAVSSSGCFRRQRATIRKFVFAKQVENQKNPERRL